MKKLLLLSFIFISAAAFSQQYSNSWIDYSKTYYKFNVGKNGLFRISQSTLNSISLGNAPAEQFQLWRNGQEVTLYTSIPTGPLGASGYIEFWGLMNDGKMDTKLYRDSNYQLSDHYSLQTDTSAYFLTVNPVGNNLRFTNAPNDVANNTLPAEPYFMNTKGNYYRNQINIGYGLPFGSYVYSSSYDIGEGWTTNDIFPNYAFSANIDSLNVYPGGPNVSFNFGVVGNALNNRNIRIKFFNTIIDDEPMPSYRYIKKQINNLPASHLSNPDLLVISFEDISAVTTDRMVVSFVELTYASKFNFNNKTNFSFELPASATGNFLVIDNFNNGSVAPVLLDISSNKRYTGDITSTPGKVKFALPPSTIAQRKFILVSEDVSAVNAISNFSTRNFTNFSVAANQGDYLIISNPLLYNNGSGVNNIDLYKAYRNSAAGGSFNAKIYNSDELVDQFAYGIKKHPSAIKDFIQFATAKFPSPKYVFLIGKGITYNDYRLNENNPYADKLNLVPTFGNPASDVLLSSPYGSIVPSIPVGRLSVISGNEVGNYLQKIQEYEAAQASPTQTLANKLWMKNIAHVIGGSDSSENDLFTYYMNQYKKIIEDTLYGGHVETFAKSSNSAVQLVSGQRIEELFHRGISLLSYFGHSSANTLAFNLSDPSFYQNQGRYPFFAVSGCTAGNNYIYDPTRITQNNMTISEKFVLASERGSIGFMASSHLGVPPYLDNYDYELYHQLGVANYGNSIGNDMKNVISSLGGNVSSIYYLSRVHMEEIALHGDPAIKINPHSKPDYVIEEQEVKINPPFISVAQNSFVLDAKAYNIGRAITDSITFEIKRTYPNGTTNVLLHKRISAINYADSAHLVVPVISARDKGLNKITVTIDADNEVDEMSESNNSIVKDFFVYEDEATPAYPYNFSIVNVDNQKLYASTANPISVAKDYVMEIDTTELFNSSKKVTRTVNAAGGAIEFDPGFSYTDSTVYYWRVSLKPATNLPSDYRWNNSSFIYLANSTPGSNQSHYYQHLSSDTQDIKLDSSRTWTFGTVQNNIYANDGVYPKAASDGSDFKVSINGTDLDRAFCGINGIVFTVIDPITLKPWQNVMGTPQGLFGSDPVCGATRISNFQFNNLTQARRKLVMNFLDSIPNNFIVAARYISGPDTTGNTYAPAWASDTAVYGANNSLYHRLKSQGFVLIDSFNRPRVFLFMYQKNNTSFQPEFVLSDGIEDKIEISKEYTTHDSLAYITSPKFGPAKAWKQMHWRGSSLEANSPDNPTVEIIGIDSTGNQSILFTVNKTMQDVDISSVSATQYPFIQLRMRNADSIKFTAYQLAYWRLNYDVAPEGALTPTLFFSSKDTLEQGDILHFGIAFKNISLPVFDSVKVKLAVIDNNNITHLIQLPKQKPLISGDTIILKYDIDTKQFSGPNILLVDFNPDNDQPEQYHFNNFLYQNFFVKADKFNPLLDVTFDGVHILNRDIVSARPHIVIKLKDESKFLGLTDTSLIKVQIRFPDGTLRTYNFDNDTLRFTPANLAAGENTATIDLSPSLSGDDDEYELIVSGKDVVGNTAGELDYHINFMIISKPMISNLLNYPNPFTTSTAFVFTVTGSVVPQNIRIQILTITGKIIREITKDELGPLHIGRNITEFKWDGSDMYGQKVANGVYLYRVLTNLNGRSMDAYNEANDEISVGDGNSKKGHYNIFVKGYGKMYFMR